MVEIGTVNKLSHTIKRLINSGDARSVKAKKNILTSFIIKGVSIVIGFIFVPLLINYLGTAEYGIWITLSSVIGWIGYFDIGLGNGLRNRFAESLARDEHKLAKIYVSTTYAGLTLLFGAFFIAFLAIAPVVNWSTVLNAPQSLSKTLETLVVLTVGFFVIRFILKLLTVIIVADQRPAISNLFDPLGNVISLIGVLFLMHYTSPSLINLGIILGFSPVLVLIIASVYFFKRDYKPYRPSLAHVNFKYFKDLAGLGLQFFVIQITVVIIMSTNNIIITQISGPEEVTLYNVAYRYFGLISMGFVIIANTFWSAFTEAYIKNDISWIKRTTKSLLRIWVAIIAAVLVMLVFAKPFYRLWVGEKVDIPFLLSLFSGLFVVLNVWITIFTYFINGTGKIRLQLYTTVAAAVVSIPLSIFLATSLKLGASGVVLGSCLAYLPVAILSPIQYYKIVNKKDHGIWGK